MSSVTSKTPPPTPINRTLAIWQRGDLSPNEKLVLLFLATRAKVGQPRWDSVATIARALSVSERSVIRTKKLLERKGLIKITKRWTADGSRITDLLLLTITNKIEIKGSDREVDGPAPCATCPTPTKSCRNSCQDDDPSGCPSGGGIPRRGGSGKCPSGGQVSAGSSGGNNNTLANRKSDSAVSQGGLVRGHKSKVFQGLSLLLKDEAQRTRRQREALYGLAALVLKDTPVGTFEEWAYAAVKNGWGGQMDLVPSRILASIEEFKQARGGTHAETRMGNSDEVASSGAA